MDTPIHARNWVNWAACKQRPEMWFATETSARTQAKHICENHCPVFEHCRAEALIQPCTHGVHAGVLYKAQAIAEPDTHQPIKSSRYCLICQPDSKAAKTLARRPLGEDARKPPVIRDICGKPAGYERHRRNGEKQCDPCREANRAKGTKKRTTTASKVRCGTSAGFRRHVQFGEEPCQPCRAAQDDYNLRAAVRRFGYCDADAYLETVDTVRKLAGERWTDREIAERLGVDQRRVLRLRRHNKIPPGVGIGGAWAVSRTDRVVAA